MRITNYVIISSETELKRQGIVDEVFRDFRSMMKYLRSVEDKDRKNLCINALEYGYDLIINYETNNNPVDFGNEVFRDYMEQLWDGWIMYEEFGMANNPYMGKTDGYVFSQENSSFCMMTSSEILSRYNNADSIKLFPLPLLSDQYKQTVKVPLVAVVNPNGKNRENAIRLLECLSEYLRETGKIGVYYKDAADYPDTVDTETSVFKQLYDINSRAVVADFGILNEICLNEIRQFQNHTIDLDTAVKSIQRKEDAYRNE